MMLTKTIMLYYGTPNSFPKAYENAVEESEEGSNLISLFNPSKIVMIDFSTNHIVEFDANGDIEIHSLYETVKGKSDV